MRVVLLFLTLCASTLSVAAPPSCPKGKPCVPNPLTTLVGCYRSGMTGFAPGFAIQFAGQNYALQIGSGPELHSQSLQSATPDQLREAGEALKQPLRDGLALRWDPDMHDRFAFGVFRPEAGSDGSRVLLYAATGTGEAEKVSCRRAR